MKALQYGQKVYSKETGRAYYIDDYGWEDNRKVYYCYPWGYRHRPLYGGCYPFNRDQISTRR